MEYPVASVNGSLQGEIAANHCVVGMVTTQEPYEKLVSVNASLFGVVKSSVNYVKVEEERVKEAQRPGKLSRSISQEALLQVEIDC